MRRLFFIILTLACQVWRSNCSQHFDPDAALLNASEHGCVTGIKDALGRGAHMGAKNNFATTPLIFAANNGHLDAVRYLLDVNAPIEDVSNNGRTPLMWACYWGHADVVKYMVARGANIFCTDYGKYQFYHIHAFIYSSSYASWCGLSKVFQLSFTHLHIYSRTLYTVCECQVL